ncbi:MAG TPA: HupE/UreJ family protein [Vicinamibacteria bacterium]|nr:HupE/UreJ family protein [Vicinamibacteria bacterium]
MRTAVGTALAALVLFPGEARAHLVTTGLGPVYDGISHFALTPEDLLPVLALALLAGLSGPRCGRAVLFVLPVAWLSGGLLGLSRSSELLLPALTASTLLALGALVALDRKLPLGLAAGLAAALGFFHGYLNGTAKLGALGLSGVAATLFVVVALVAAFVVSLRAPWSRIAVRVAGSWLVAISMLMLGWAFRAG